MPQSRIAIDSATRTTASRSAFRSRAIQDARFGFAATGE